MNRSAVNSSSSASGYYWADCNTDVGSGKFGVPSAGLLIFITTECFEFFVGAPANLWLVCHILRKRSKVTGVLPADFFPLHLALTHLFFYLALPPFIANHYLWQSEHVMAIMNLLTSMVIIMKPLLLGLVCVENYMAVVRPLDYLRFKAHRYRWGCLGVSWCIYVIMASAIVSDQSSLTVWVLFSTILAIDTFCSVSVLKTLQKPPPGDENMVEKKKKGKEKGNGSGAVQMEEKKQEQSRRKEGRKEEQVKKVKRGEQRGKREMNSMKKKAFITIIIIQVVLTLNYLPYIITMPMGGQVPAWTLKCQYQAMALAAAASVSYLQPLLYLHRLGRLPCLTSQRTWFNYH